MSNNAHEVAKREALPLPNVEKYIPLTGPGEERGSRAFPEQPEGHRAYVARPQGEPNSPSKPLGTRPVTLDANGCNRGHSLGNRHVQRAK